jgi:Na+-transporting NADH:ubiquinone oxidoreductase subunit NqrF
MRIRKNEDLIKKSYTSIKLQKEYFNEDIKSVVKKGDISKIYLCGSPLMNAAIGKILIEEGVK